MNKEELKKLIDQGYDKKDIADYYGIGTTTLGLRLKDLNLTLTDLKKEVFRENILSEHSLGKTCQEIRDKFGYSLKIIRKYIKEAGLETHTKIIKANDPELIAKVSELVDEGKTNKEISEILNISTTLARRYTYLSGKDTNSVKEKPLKELNLTQEQLDLIYGSSLGDLYMELYSKNSRIVIHHGGEQEKYFDYKCEVLKNLLTKNIFKGDRFDKRTNKSYRTYSAKTHTHPKLTKIYNLIYPDKHKTVTLEWLKKITPRGLAYWFMDDGTNKGGLSTLGYTLDENKLIQQWLEDTYGVKTSLHKVKSYCDPSQRIITGTKECYYNLVLCTSTRKKFDDLIRPYIIDSMLYKLQYK